MVGPQHIILSFLALAVIQTPRSSYAAEVPSSNHLEQIYQQRVEKIIERFAQRREFYISTEVEPAAAEVSSLPYEPSADGLGRLQSLTNAELKKITKSVKIEISLSTRFDTTFREKIGDIIRGNLNLNEQAGDSLLFSASWIPPQLDQDAQRKVFEAEERLRNQERLVRELEEAKRLAEAKLATLGQETKALGLNASSEDRGNLSDESSRTEAFISATIRSAPYVGLGVLALLLLFLIARISGKTFEQAFGGVAKALQAASAAGGQKHDQKSAPAELASQNPSQTGLADTSALYSRLADLHEELCDAVRSGGEAVVLGYVSELTRSRASEGQAAATLEVLGKDLANELFAKLGKSTQAKILDFMRTRSHPGERVTALIDAAEKLKIRLFAASLTQDETPAYRTTKATLASLSADDIADFARSLDGDNVIAKLISMLEPGDVGQLLQTVRISDDNLYGALISASLTAAEIKVDEELDTLSSHLEKFINEHSSPRLDDQIDYFLKLLDHVDTDDAEEIFNQIEISGRAELFAELRSQYVGYPLFFDLEPQHQIQLMTGLSHARLAALARSDERFESIALPLLSSFMQELVREEMDRLANSSPLALRSRFEEAKTEIIQGIKDLRDEFGSLTAITSRPEANNRGVQNAA